LDILREKGDQRETRGSIIIYIVITIIVVRDGSNETVLLQILFVHGYAELQSCSNEIHIVTRLLFLHERMELHNY
jgi:hypothetical protein